MTKIGQYLGQAVAYLVFCSVVVFFSVAPDYEYLPPGHVEIRLAFNHAAKQIHTCHKRSRDELMKLPPNMRKVMDCPRERAPLVVELLWDGTPISQRTFRPSGLHKDGATFVYAKIPQPAGTHRFTVRMRDHVGSEAFDYVAEKDVALSPGQALVVGFDSQAHRFTFSR
jgi:hypothetical protein